MLVLQDFKYCGFACCDEDFFNFAILHFMQIVHESFPSKMSHRIKEFAQDLLEYYEGLEDKDNLNFHDGRKEKTVNKSYLFQHIINDF